MKTIELPCFGIVIHTDGEGGGAIGSDLKDDPNLDHKNRSIELGADDLYLATIDGIESMILAHACAGIDVESPAYIEGIETAVEGAANNL